MENTHTFMTEEEFKKNLKGESYLQESVLFPAQWKAVIISLTDDLNTLVCLGKSGMEFPLWSPGLL